MGRCFRMGVPQRPLARGVRYHTDSGLSLAAGGHSGYVFLQIQVMLCSSEKYTRLQKWMFLLMYRDSSSVMYSLLILLLEL